MSKAGERVPPFAIQTVDGRHVRYADIWQRHLLLLLSLPAAGDAAEEAYAEELRARSTELSTSDAEIVVTREPVEGIRPPAAVVADRWGEILMVAEERHLTDLPSPADLIEWLRYAEHQCPECEGEAR